MKRKKGPPKGKSKKSGIMANKGLAAFAIIGYVSVFASDLLLGALMQGLIIDARWGFGNFYLAIVGAVMAVAGVLFSFFARFNLGRSYHVVPDANKLVTTGVYRFFRHPCYVGNMVGFLGLAILLGSIVGLVLTLLVLIPVHIARARSEEKVLIEAFGEDYIEYKKKTIF